jgi:putative ABC transport system substrate-binding protein
VFGRAATYVDRILKGAHPSEMPIGQPSKLDLLLNLTTAAAIGLQIPEAVLLRADETIDDSTR